MSDPNDCIVSCNPYLRVGTVDAAGVTQDFDYQWKNLPSPDLEYNEQRVKEFIDFTKRDPIQLVRQKYCLDVGCGNGRYTYAMQKLGAMRVDSIDISSEAVTKCKQINPDAKVIDLMESENVLYPVYEFVLCFGVLNHVQNPREGFRLVSHLVRPVGGYLHVMVYNQAGQSKFEIDRKLWATLTLEEKLKLCEDKARTVGGTVHGWWDALNPTYNHSFHPDEIVKWFREEGFDDTRLITGINGKENININAKKGNPKKLDYGMF